MPPPVKTIADTFIPAALDDAGLSPVQFRVLCHISRREQCSDKLKTLSSICRINKDTAASAIRDLISLGLVSRESRAGRTSVLRISKPNPSESKGYLPSETEGYLPSETEGYLPSETEGHGLSDFRGYKGPQGSPFKGGHPRDSDAGETKPDGHITFAPIRPGLFPREYQAMLDAVREEIENVKSCRDNHEWKLTSESLNWIAKLEGEGRHQEVETYKRRHDAYAKSGLKQEAKEILSQLRKREKDLVAAMKGGSFEN